MAKPKFVVQHFLVCQDAPWLGVPGPRTLRSLEGVGYYHSIPANAEMPELDFWVYLRLFQTNNVTGRCKLKIDLIWLDAPQRQRRIRTFQPAVAQFWAQSPIVELTVHLDTFQIPGRGRFEFRLYWVKRSRLDGDRSEVIGREYIYIG